MVHKSLVNLEFAGWGYPLMARKGHYYSKGQSVSLCGKWLFTGERFIETDSFDGHCAVCNKRLAKLEGSK